MGIKKIKDTFGTQVRQGTMTVKSAKTALEGLNKEKESRKKKKKKNE